MRSRYFFESEEHEALRGQVRKFAKTQVAPFAQRWEENEEFPRELYAQAAQAGLTGIGYPEAYGGAGGDFSHMMVAADELILAGQSVGTAVGLGSHAIA